MDDFDDIFGDLNIGESGDSTTVVPSNVDVDDFDDVFGDVASLTEKEDGNVAGDKEDEGKPIRSMSQLLKDADDILAGIDDDLVGEWNGDDLESSSADVGTKTNDAPSEGASPPGERTLIESELRSQPCDVDALRAICANGVPNELRASVWKAILFGGEASKEVEIVSHAAEKTFTPVVSACFSVAEATFSSLKESQMTIGDNMARVLSSHIASNQIRAPTSSHAASWAWIALPFFLPTLKPILSQQDRAACLSEFFALVVPQYLDVKQCALAVDGNGVSSQERDMFKRLVTYHDPLLYLHLETSSRGEHDDSDGERFDWIVEALANLYLRNIVTNSTSGSAVDVKIFRWIQCFLMRTEVSPAWRHFICLAVLLHHREVILLRSSARDIDTSLRLMCPTTDTLDSTKRLSMSASAFEVFTPLSARRSLDQISEGTSSPPHAALDVDNCNDGCPCLVVTASEMLTSIGRQHYRQTKKTSSSSSSLSLGLSSHEDNIRYFLIDCRSESRRTCQVGYGRLGSNVFSVDSAWLRENDETGRAKIANALKALKPMRGKAHLCLVGSSRPPLFRGLILHGTPEKNGKQTPVDDAKKVASLLIRQGFPYVSVVRGGFESIARFLRSRQELANLLDFRPGPDAQRQKTNPETPTRNATKKGFDVMMSSAAANVVATRRENTPSSTMKTPPPQDELEILFNETTQKALSSIKSISSTIGLSAKSTWGSLQTRFQNRNASAASPSMTADEKSKRALFQEKMSKGAKSVWSWSSVAATSGLERLKKSGSSMIASLSVDDRDTQPNQMSTKGWGKMPSTERPQLSSSERSALALERHRLSGLQKLNRIAVRDLNAMCDRLDPSVGESTKMFECVKLRRIDGQDEPERVKRILLVTSHRLLTLDLGVNAVLASGTGDAIVKSNHHLTELKKLSFSKKDPTLVTLYYKKRLNGEDIELKTNAYRIDEAEAFIHSLTTRLRALRAGR